MAQGRRQGGLGATLEVTGGSLSECEGDDGGGVGAKDSGAEGDGMGAGVLESLKFLVGEASFGADPDPEGAKWGGGAFEDAKGRWGVLSGVGDEVEVQLVGFDGFLNA